MMARRQEIATANAIFERAVEIHNQAIAVCRDAQEARRTAFELREASRAEVARGRSSTSMKPRAVSYGHGPASPV